MYDISRRLGLMRSSKAYVKRGGFSRHCSVIASAQTEHLLKAMALHGERADIRELIRSPDVDVSLKKALASVLAASANILGTEGQRSKIRLRGHAAGWHYGTTHLFVTPNLADSRAPMFLQLHLQDVQGQVEEFQVNLNWDLEEPSLPSLPAMWRALAADPVSQARFFHEMMLLFFEEILGTLPPMTRASYHVGLARNFEDAWRGRRPCVMTTDGWSYKTTSTNARSLASRSCSDHMFSHFFVILCLFPKAWRRVLPLGSLELFS